MSTTTKIDWTDTTWNVTSGCTPISPGCAHCYAARMHAHLAAMGQTRYAHPFAEVRTHPDALAAPFHWRRPRRIFVNSMSDLFHESVPDAFIDQVLAVIALCPQHTFQVLTKRAARMEEYFHTLKRRMGGPSSRFDHIPQEHRDALDKQQVPWPLPNLWLGVTAENQQTADERIPHLLATPAAVRFVSCEPLLGPIDLASGLRPQATDPRSQTPNLKPEACRLQPALSWVICGGETGPGARPMHPDWARSLRDQCATAAVPYFFKQWGAWAPALASPLVMRGHALVEPNGTWTIWDGKTPLCRAPRQNAAAPGQQAVMFRPRTYSAGYLLDGVEHRAFPK